MAWFYEQNTGKQYDPEGILEGTGYSGGQAGNAPYAINNHYLQNVRGVGPIPCGIYRFGTPTDGTHLGPFAIPLIPDEDNNMFGRSAFYIHGDNFSLNHSASDGCIVHMRSLREKMWNSSNHVLLVYFNDL